MKLAPPWFGSQVRSPSCWRAIRRAMARPSPLPGAAAFESDEALEDPLALAFGDAGPVVGDPRFDVAVGAAECDGTSPPGRDRRERVVEQVAKSSGERVGSPLTVVSAERRSVTLACGARARLLRTAVSASDLASDRASNGVARASSRASPSRSSTSRPRRAASRASAASIGLVRGARAVRAAGSRCWPAARRSACAARARRRRGTGEWPRRSRVPSSAADSSASTIWSNAAAMLPSSVSVRLGRRRCARVAAGDPASRSRSTWTSGRSAARVPRSTSSAASASATSATSSSTRSRLVDSAVDVLPGWR